MTQIAVKTKNKKSVDSKRPAFESEYLDKMRQIITRLNEASGLKAAALTLEANLDKKGPKKYEDGTNWGSSYYEEWGNIDIKLVSSEKFVDLASYKVRTVDGGRELSTNTHIAKRMNYSDGSFEKLEGFSILLAQISGSAATAITDVFKLKPTKVAKIEKDLARICKQLEGEQKFKLAIEEAARNLQRTFPGQSLQQIITGPLADYAFGPKAPWSNMERRFVDTMPANVGACVMCLYLDGLEPEPWIVIGERPNPNKPGDFLYNGSGGGFGNLLFPKKLHETRVDKAYGEQPRETAVRELGEENRTPANQAVFDLDPAQLKLIDDGCGIDYSAVTRGGFPTAYIMYYAALNDEQKTAAKSHAAGMEDEAYRKACAAHTGNETSRVRVMRLAAAAELPIEQAAYPHEAKAFKTLQAMYKTGKLAL